jgi:alpha-L-rhamnosidase
VEWALNPEMPVNRNFLENFALPAHFAYIPEGMLPMCYPADHPNGRHIPQWAMWFFLQLSDYAKHGGDAELIASLQARYEALYAYLCRYENELGLLESLPSWNFVEWSFANDLVDGLNYPTNMLYVAFLQAGAQLFGDSALSEKASAVAAAVRAHAFDGTYFRDHDVRDANGALVPCTDRTETCQYYAFYFGIATPQSHPTLWEKLLCVFGPARDAKTVEPQIHPSNAFMGNYMRLELLRRYGMRDRMLAELEDYFYGMTQKTGTLWENMYTAHSCCHGFASYAIYLMQKE